MTIKAFSLDILTQLSVISTTFTLINIAMNTLISYNRKVNEIIDDYHKNSKGNRMLPLKIEKMKKYKPKKHMKALLLLYTIIMGNYFIIILINNFMSELMIKSTIAMDIGKVYLNEKLISICNWNWWCFFIGTVLTWIQLFLVIILFILFIKLLWKYFKVLAYKM